MLGVEEMLKEVDNKLIKKALKVTNQSLSKESIEKLYRGDRNLNFFNTLRELQIIYPELNASLLNALFVHYGVKKKTKAELNKMYMANPVNDETLQDRVNCLLADGVDKEFLERKYISEEKSLDDVTKEIKKISDVGISNKTLKSVMEYYGIATLSDEEVEKRRLEHIKETYSRKTEERTYLGLTIHEIVDLYINDETQSLQKIADKYKVAPVTLRMLIQQKGYKVRRQTDYRDIMQKLEVVGFGKDKFYEEYIINERSQTELKQLIKEVIGESIGDKTLNNILKTYDIKKTAEQIKRTQGGKSRKEKDFSFERLKKAGFNSPEEVAKYYDENKSVTIKSLAEELNKRLGEEFFTERWLVRYVTPYTSRRKTQGVSRTESNFAEILYKLLPDVEIKRNDRTVITPSEIDFYIPSLKLGIEFNGDYWHSDKFLMENKNLSAMQFHAVKNGLAAAAGVTLFFVWESDWVNKPEVVTTALQNYLDTGEIDRDILLCYSKQ